MFILKYKEVNMRSLGQKAETLRLMAHPVRIRILGELTKGVKCVSDLGEFLEISQPNVSQHLSLLRRQGIIDYYMDGRLRCYFLRDPVVPELLKALGKDYRGDLPAPACCPITKRGKYTGRRKNKNHGEVKSGRGQTDSAFHLRGLSCEVQS